ncbi:MAG: DUF349 domain-containing protein [Bacteroidales bacterium]|nr:DUF349 domain-containing protein [Bacteroidales bacterium]MBQ2599447.1 DUF349 domain-containing protein [Bacteroidales bacterium]
MSEDLNPVVPAEEQPVEIKEEAIVEEAAAQTSDQPNAESVPETAPENTRTDFSNMGLKEIVDTFKELIDGENMQQLYKHAEALKAAFYKNLRKEKIASGVEQPAETPAAAPAEGQEADAEPQAEETETVSFNPFAEIERGFKDLYSQYKVKRAAFTQEIEKQKEENYQVKTALIDELKALVEASEDLKETFPKFRDIQARWRAAGPVPQAKMKDLYDTYQHFVEKFYDYVKINKEFRDLDFKKNLEAKERLCAKAEALADEEDAVGAFRTLQKLHEQWKELGPVSKEFRDSIWERFRAATSVINKKHQAYFESQKGSQKENFEAKTALCEKVEEIAKTEVTDSTQWNKLTKEIEAIQKEWKTIGFASKKENQKVYDRFRAACDEFFARKRDYYAGFKSQMQDNLARKIELCEKAEALKDSTDWKKTSEDFIELQRQWKEIGPVSRKKSDQVWKRFRAACDAFFDSRDKHAGGQNAEQAENLEKKRQLIDEIRAFAAEGKEDTREALRAFQERWNAIGFVPFKEKTRIQDAYRKAISEVFGEFREGAGRFAGKAERAVRSERDRLVQKFMKKEQEIATWENNMGFFSQSKNAEALLEELNKKIDIARQELASLEEEIKEFDRQHEQE